MISELETNIMRTAHTWHYMECQDTDGGLPSDLEKNQTEMWKNVNAAIQNDILLYS